MAMQPTQYLGNQNAFLFGRFTLSFRSRSASRRTATVIHIAIPTGGISKQRRQRARVSIPIALRSAAANTDPVISLGKLVCPLKPTSISSGKENAKEVFG